MSLGDDIGRLIHEARGILARGEVSPLISQQPPAWEALEKAAQESRALLADALEFLDSVTPEEWTFLQWVDGAFWVHPEAAVDDPRATEIACRYGRKQSDVLGLMAAAAQRAMRIGDGMQRWLDCERSSPFTPEQLKQSEDAA